MDKYFYRVVSNKPLQIFVGTGNMPSISHSENGFNLTQMDAPRIVESSGAASSVGHAMSLELIEVEMR